MNLGIKREKLLYFTIGLSIILAGFDFMGLLKGIKQPIDTVVIPVKRTIFASYSGIAEVWRVLLSYNKIKNDVNKIADLYKQNEELIYKLKQTTQENKELRGQLEAPLPASFSFIPAKVISKARFLEVASGEVDGVLVGMPVVTGDTLLGIISSVWPLRSQAKLVGDSELVVPVQTSRGAKGIISGTGGTILLDKILQKDPLFLDDTVATSGEDNYPPDLLIGEVSYINSADSAVYKQAKITSLTNLTSESMVFIISSK